MNYKLKNRKIKLNQLSTSKLKHSFKHYKKIEKKSKKSVDNLIEESKLRRVKKT